MSDREVVVLSGVRTPVADFGGSLKDVPPTELAGKVVAEAVQRSGLEPADIGHCVVGTVTHSDRRDMYMARVAALKGGLPVETPALTVNRLCGSGLQAVISAAQMILLDDCDAAVAGGAESMSRVPYWLPKARFGARMGDGTMEDPMMGALTCPIGFQNRLLGCRIGKIEVCGFIIGDWVELEYDRGNEACWDLGQTGAIEVQV